MVIVIFENPEDTRQTHACVAYRADLDGGTLASLKIFNPWGNKIEIDKYNKGPMVNILNDDDRPFYWQIISYIALDY